EVERVKTNQTRTRVQQLVGQHDGDVELRVAGQAEARPFIPGVELVEHELESVQSFVGVLRRVIDAMVVVPHGAQRLVDVAERLMVGSEARLVRRVVVMKILFSGDSSEVSTVAFGSAVDLLQAAEYLLHTNDALLKQSQELI